MNTAARCTHCVRAWVTASPTALDYILVDNFAARCMRKGGRWYGRKAARRMSDAPYLHKNKLPEKMTASKEF